ncbi:MAG: ADP-ribosylglycohydrolase family protein [Methanomicrobiales archaeon]|nr:ADP-ribosylglycohydrolase family protein [Methanomicrobiales archaeon]
MILILEEARAVGLLLGLAVGDALGAPREGLPPPRFPVWEMRGGGIHGLPAGSVTDDTLQAAAVARSLVACRGYAPGDMTARLLDEYLRHRTLFGPTSTGVFTLLLEGVPAGQAPAVLHRLRHGSRSNGAVMRGLPLAVMFTPPALDTVSMSCSLITHHDPVAGTCSLAVNRIAADLCRGVDRDSALSRAVAACPPGEVREVLSRYAEIEPVASLDAVAMTHCAIRVLMEAETFEEAVVRAVNLGGDSDTAGAVSGALAGAWGGIDAVPRRWLAALHDGPELLELARALWSASRPG